MDPPGRFSQNTFATARSNNLGMVKSLTTSKRLQIRMSSYGELEIPDEAKDYLEKCYRHRRLRGTASTLWSFVLTEQKRLRG